MFASYRSFVLTNSEKAGYGAQRHPLNNDVWERLSASTIAAGKPLPQEKI